MKFLHISDLHIGKRLDNFSLLEDQADILAQILTVARERQVQGLLIAGDVYDKAAPGGEGVELFDRFLTQAAQSGLEVFIISGNHDSPQRLAFAGRLLASCRVHLSPVFSGKVEPVLLHDDFGEVAVYLLPFLKPALVREFWPEVQTSAQAVQAAVEAMEIDPRRQNLLVAHQLVFGGKKSGSEEVWVGGSDGVEASLFDPFDYVALGHLHGPQWVGRETLRYCGSPLKYSFNEVNQQKSLTLVSFEGKGKVSLELIPLTPKRDLREIRGRYEEITLRSFYENFNKEDYIRVILTDEEDVLDAMARLRTIYPNLAGLGYDNARTRQDRVVDSPEGEEEKSPLELLGELYRLQNNRELSPEQEALAKTQIRRIWGEGGVS